jgi:hypothetical protein
MEGFPRVIRSAIPIAILLAASAGAIRAGEVIINEIHYEPVDVTKLEEFVELHNPGTEAADISGWYFSEGIRYVFPAGTTIAAGGYLVVAENPTNLTKKYPGVSALGPFEGHLSNDGEVVELRDAQGMERDQVDYALRFPWPMASAGDGSSMELIHPSLDNDLGGSWRASTAPASLPQERTSLLPPGEVWRVRKGTSEASDPSSAWRGPGFVEDASWFDGRAPIGFGTKYQNATVLDDMQSAYTTAFLRRVFLVEGTPPPALKIRLFVDDGCIISINGVEVLRRNVTSGEKPFNATSGAHEGRWEEYSLPAPEGYLASGENVIAVHLLNQSLAGDDLTFDADLLIPARTELPAAPTPGEKNSVWAENAAPHVRQVGIRGTGPRSGEPIVVTAKVTDPEGVSAVTLRYQIVLPGAYIPSHLALEPATLMSKPTQAREPNPAFEDPANWTETPMSDNGLGADEEANDDIWTGEIPPQGNRTLVRYRVAVADLPGAAATVPCSDDPSLNFAAFVYDGLPPFAATKLSVYGAGGHTYPEGVMDSLPVYFLITRAEEMARCVAYNGAWQIPKSNEAARDAFNWEGAFVYRGVVHDHIHYRLRQANDRYGGGGKRSFRFRFNRGSRLQAHDNYGNEYPTCWRTLNTGKMFDNLRVGNFGLTESINAVLWNLVGVPAPFTHTFHMRVIDGPDEAPAGVNGQYYGDFWGMALAVEDYDPNFIEAHGLADGNLYKLKDGVFDGRQLKRNQGRYSVLTDADFQNIRTNLRPTKTAEWLDQNVNYDRWYPYHTVVEAIRHYDFVPADTHSKNRAWFFEPAEGSPFGRLWTLPWDADASWGPNWNSGIDYSTQAIATGADKAPFRLAYRNVIREFRDLVWTEEVVGTCIDDLAALITEFAKADRDRWRSAPSDAGTQDFGPMETKVKDMKNFAFVGWSGATGPAVGAGGRAKYLDALASAESDSTRIPSTPTISYAGPDGHPIDGLVFDASPFSDPQGDATFAAMEWRAGEITPAALGSPFLPRRREWDAVWRSGEVAPFEARAQIPVGPLLPGRTYRVRVRMKDDTGRWSHWSAPVEFVAGSPAAPIPQVEGLRITEIMYDPAEGGDLEFIEIGNIGTRPADLDRVSIEGGIRFAFAGSAVTSLAPGEHAVAVKNLSLFGARYDTGRIRVAGEYAGRLDNGGERIYLLFADDMTILDFTYSAAWHPETAGLGRSLVIADPGAPIEDWSRAEGWRASGEQGGSPGAAEGGSPLRLPGDATDDAVLDIADPINLLLLLYEPIGPPPCEGAVNEGGNAVLLDSNGDGAVDLADPVHILRHLYLGGPPHVLGTRCVAVSGCPAACRE